MKINNKVNNIFIKSAFAMCVILCMIFNCFDTFDYSKENKVKAENISAIFGDNYKTIDDVKWSRTPDYYGNECEAYVNNTLANNGTNGYKGQFNTNDYWTKEGNTYYLNKETSNYKPGIIWMPNLLPCDNGVADLGYNVKLDYDTLLYYLNPTKTDNVWDGKSGDVYAPDRVQKVKDANNGGIPQNFPDFATWGYCAYKTSNTPKRYGDQLRLFRGEFELSEEDIKNYDFFITVGDNKELILPIDDTMIVLVDGEPTGINFTSSVNAKDKSITIHNGSKQGDDGNGNYNIKFKLTSCTDPNNEDRGKKADCSDATHAAISAFTDGLHAHLDLVENDKILGDITNILCSNSTSLNSDSKYNHKIEVLCSDYNISGGMTKLQLIKVRKPEVKTTKEAYFHNGEGDKLVGVGTSDGSKNVSDTIIGQGKLTYDLTYSNVGETDVKDVEFNDVDLGVKVSKDGLFVNGTKIDNPETLTITKGNETKTGNDALSLLQELKVGESVKVSDITYLSKDIAGTEGNITINNTVKVNSNYLIDSKTEESEANTQVNLKDDVDLSIKKSINTVIREGKEIYNKSKNKELPRIYPGDEITFAVEVTNKGKSKAINLSLKDILSNKDGKIFKNSEWTFVKEDGRAINADNFELDPLSTLNLTTNKWVVSNDARYILNNKVELYRNSELADTSFTEFTVYPRVYINMKCDKPDIVYDKNGNPKEKVRYFYVKVIGTNSEGKNVFTTSMYLKDGDRVEIDNLDFNVNYKVVETVPMHFTLRGIDINGKNKVPNNLTFDLMTIDNPSEITLYNTREDSKSFNDKDEKCNNLNNIKF